MRSKRSVARRPLPAWVTTLVIVALVVLLGLFFWHKTRGPASILPERTPELERIQKEMTEYFRQHPERVGPRARGGAGTTRPGRQGAPTSR